jgi:pimeloyl-ACP methyl ester carboxylesterase
MHPMTWKPNRPFPGAKCWFNLAAVALLLFLVGCATPIGTRVVGIRQTYEKVNRNAIRADAYSETTGQVLHRFSLQEQFEKDPAKTIEILHDRACEDDRRDLLYTLSELTYLSANRVRSGTGPDGLRQARQYYLASAVYGYFYLLGDRGGEPPDAYDRRFRVASDLYNTAIAQALLLRQEGPRIRNSLQQLPVGTVHLELRQDQFPYDLESFETFIPADELSVYGLTVRDRRPGLGAPFIAVGKKTADWPIVRSIPGTLFLRVEGDIRDLRQGARGQLEFYSSYEKKVTEVHDKKVPLENDLSAQLAYSLNQPYFWDIGQLEFLKGAVVKSGVFPIQPYSPGRIPVVFVHGTFSSPAWWAEMFNTLRADPVLWQRYQFWFYLYDSSKPTVLSAVEFRESLTKMVETLDPGGRDAALKKMVVVGHSQGGLLTKLTAVETGDALIRALTQKGLDELDLNASERSMTERYLVYSPLPFVSRAVFISTPHRGSYLSKQWVRDIVRKIIFLPLDVLSTTTSIFLTAEKIGITGIGGADVLHTSLDAMKPNHPAWAALAEIGLAPGITGHSIISIDGDETPPDGDDGVVKYTSAHVDYVQSEFIVRTGHSSQGHPLVIEEVRRILLAHLDSLHGPPVSAVNLMPPK